MITLVYPSASLACKLIWVYMTAWYLRQWSRTLTRCLLFHYTIRAWSASGIGAAAAMTAMTAMGKTSIERTPPSRKLSLMNKESTSSGLNRAISRSQKSHRSFQLKWVKKKSRILIFPTLCAYKTRWFPCQASNSTTITVLKTKCTSCWVSLPHSKTRWPWLLIRSLIASSGGFTWVYCHPWPSSSLSSLQCLSVASRRGWPNPLKTSLCNSRTQDNSWKSVIW